jgi:lysylphosphatidylglycerol synthetase-like protein (DUF2156 family)
MISEAMPSAPAVVEVPSGSRVVVAGDLLLPTAATESSVASVAALATELDLFQGVGVMVITGDLVACCDDLPGALAAHPALGRSVAAFLESDGRRVVVIPGNRTLGLLAEAGGPLAALGIEIESELVLDCSTAAGVRRVWVAPADSDDPCPIDAETMVERPWLAGADRLEDPKGVRMFTSSRTLYRRLTHWLWIPPLVAVVAVGLGQLAFVESGLRRTRRGAFVKVADTSWNTRVLIAILAIVLAEVIVGIAVMIITRRTYAGAIAKEPRGEVSRNAEADRRLDRARSWLAEGGTGVIASGSTSAVLSHLDSGFFAAPGSSAEIVREHQGHLGMPPVFLAHHQESVLELETGADLHVRLVLRDRVMIGGGRIERLVASDPISPLPPAGQGARLVASWPTGGAWPPPADLADTLRRTRRVRRLAAVSIFLAGVSDLLVAVIPPLRAQLHVVRQYLPLGISQTAAAAVVITGLALVMLSRGILRGQRRSWLIAVIILGASLALHLAHTANIVSFVLTALVLALLLLERRWFRGTTDRGSLKAAAPVIGLVLAVTVTAAFIGIELSDLHREPLPAWPLVLLAVIERLIGLSTIALPEGIDDFVYPAMLSVGIGVITTVLYLATRPVVDRRLSEHHLTAERRAAEIRARDIVKRHGRGTLDYFALRDDKQFFLFGDSLVAYAVFGGIALVSPDPIGPDAERFQVWSAFRAFTDSHGWGVGVVGAGEEWLPIYAEAGMRWIYLGDEAVVDLTTFSLEGGKMKGLRQANTRMARYGYTVEFLDPSTIEPSRVPGLIEIMGLSRTGEEERGFSMMLGRLFDPRDTGLLLTVVSDPEGRPAAMCQFVPSPAIEGYSLDLMRRDTGEHPNGLLDYALCSTIDHLRDRGATGLSLNFAAFRSILDGEKGDGITQRVERWGLKRLSAVLPIETLWRFNEKYLPHWLARHLVYASPEQFVPTVAAAMRAEALADIPVLGRFLSQDPTNRPGMAVPAELLEGRAVTPIEDIKA